MPFRVLRVAGLRDAHPHVVGGEHLRVLFTGRLRPGDLFAQVGAHRHGALEVETVGHDAVRTGGDHHLVGLAVLHVLLDDRASLVGAEGRMALAGDDAELVGDGLLQLVHVDGVGDAAALTEIDANLVVSHCPYLAPTA